MSLWATLGNLNWQVKISNLWLTDMKGREKDINGNYLRLCHPDGITSAALRTCRNAAWVSVRSSQRQPQKSCLLWGKGRQTGTRAESVPSSPPVVGLPTLSTSVQVCLKWRERQNSQKLSREQQEGCANCKKTRNCTAVAQAHLHLYYFHIIKIL